jgi:hypothetical protein
MRKLRRTVLVAVLGSLCATPASAAPLAPTGPWVVDYSNDQCVLDRNYGTDAKPMILAIRSVPMDPDVSLGVLTRGGRADAAVGDATIRFGEAVAMQAAFRAYSVPAKDLRSFMTYVPYGAPLMAGAAESGLISVGAPHEVQATFQVPALSEGLRALDACVLDLGQSWGMTAEQQKSFLQPEDFSGELERNANLRPQVRLWIDENGKGLDCVPLKATSSEEFASRACRLLLQRASFSPARDADGKPMKSLLVYTVDWFAG